MRFADILMVWHSLLLNPSFFKKYCKENSIENMPRVVFPWLAIVRPFSPFCPFIFFYVIGKGAIYVGAESPLSWSLLC
jgi:hypothetical protein